MDNKKDEKRGKILTWAWCFFTLCSLGGGIEIGMGVGQHLFQCVSFCVEVIEERDVWFGPCFLSGGVKVKQSLEGKFLLDERVLKDYSVFETTYADECSDEVGISTYNTCMHAGFWNPYPLFLPETQPNTGKTDFSSLPGWCLTERMLQRN